MKLLAGILLAALTALPARAVVVDTFNLNVLNSSGTSSSAVLSTGVDYLITVSGTFDINCSGPCDADAEYYVFNSTSYDRTGFSNTPGVGQEVGVGIDDGVNPAFDVDWGAFAPSHIYSTVFTGLGSTVKLFYQDSFYPDNVGDLQVKIETVNGVVPIPLPAAAWLLLTGLAGMAGLRRFGIRAV